MAIAAVFARTLTERKLQSKFFNPFARTRMNRKNNRALCSQLFQACEDLAKRLGIVDVSRAVQGQESIADDSRIPHILASSWSKAQFLQFCGRICICLERQQRIDHRVSDKMNLVSGDPFVEQILDSTFLGDEEKISHMIRENSIDLLRHGLVKRAQPRLHMCNQRP